MKTILIIFIFFCSCTSWAQDTDSLLTLRLAELQKELNDLKNKIQEGDSNPEKKSDVNSDKQEEKSREKLEDMSEEVKLHILNIKNNLQVIKNSPTEIESELRISEVYKEIELASDLIKKNINNSNLINYFEGKIKSFEELAKNLISFNNSKSKVSVIGDAALINSNSEDKTINGIGLIGLNFLNKTRRLEITGLINLIGSQDTAAFKKDTVLNVWGRSEFGRSVLNPFSGSNNFLSGIITSKFYFGKAWSDYYNIGLLTNIGFASQNWKDTMGLVEQANILSTSIGIFWNVLSRDINLNEEFQLIPFANLTSRIIYGDIRSNDEFMKRALGSSRKDFWGLELGFQIKFSQFSAFVTLPLFSGSTVKGITDGQFVAGLSVNTALKVVEF